MTSVGPPSWNYPAFGEMAERLRNGGYEVISPHELHAPTVDTAWDWYLRRDLCELVKCGRVVMLPGWEESRGAVLEHQVAESLGMVIIYPDGVERHFPGLPA